MITDKILLFPDDFKEISQSEYKTLKKIDPKNVNGYTARIRFKYFKLKEKAKLSLNKAVSELESEWDKLNRSQQEQLKEIVIERIKTTPSNLRLSIG